MRCTNILLFSLIIWCNYLPGQDICTFDEPMLPVDTFAIDFSDQNGFECSEVFFHNEFFSDFGGFWKSGWAISSRTNIADRSANNPLSAITGTGSSATPVMNNTGAALQYAIGQQDAYILLDPDERKVESIDITNTAYLFQVLLFGNDSARPMGGIDGGDPDFFLLTIQGYKNDIETGTAVEFFLADYQSLDNDLDFIVDTWQTVDLSPIEVADSIVFTLSSSDVGEFGINQPLFFAVDNLVTTSTTTNTSVPIEVSLSQIQIAPNPAREYIQVTHPFQTGTLAIYDSGGQLVHQQFVSSKKMQIPIAYLPKGIYFIQTSDGNKSVGERFVIF
ncbi:MAG: DUF4465 domain-containing protein [Bacteroidota bacterium]